MSKNNKKNTTSKKTITNKKNVDKARIEAKL